VTITVQSIMQKHARGLFGAVTLALALTLFAPTFVWMTYEFGLPRNDLSHGWMVPFFSATVIWLRRHELRQAFAAGRPDWRGICLSVFGLALFWLGNRGGQMRFCHLALLLEVWSLPFALFGPRVARLMMFPAAFLVFTMPMGFLDFFTIRLRLITATASSVLLNGLGIPVVREGTALHALAGTGFNLDVADPCSGLRSLFAMTALTAAYAYLTVRGRLRQAMLFLLAVPLAVFGNTVRILSIAVVARFFGSEAATGFYHDYSGYVVFLVAVLLMVQAGHWIGRLPGFRLEALFNRDVSGCGAAPDAAPWRVRDRLRAGAVPLALALILVLQARLPLPAGDAADLMVPELPAAFGDYRGDIPLFCHNEQCLHRILRVTCPDGGEKLTCPKCGGPLFDRSLGEATVLPADTVIAKRLYTAASGADIEMSVVVSGRSRMSIHRPELCLPAQGFAMTGARTLSVPLPGRGPLSVRVVSVQKGATRFILCYWFKNREQETSSHAVRILSDAWARSVHNRINRWVMFALTVNLLPDATAADDTVREAVADLYPQIRIGGG
jgi:exosortase